MSTQEKGSGMKKKTLQSSRKRTSARSTPSSQWDLRLYVADGTPRGLAAIGNLKRLCETHLKGRYRLEVIDLLEHPQLASGDQVTAIPTLVRRLPPPVRKIIGDLSNGEDVLVRLDLRPRK